MASKIESYNASYPAAYYSTGTVYAFYGRKTSSGSPAPEKYIQLYASTLRNIETGNHQNAIQPVKSSNTGLASNDSGMTRFYAVVVEKSTSSIVVMFICDNNGEESYITRKYVVNGSCLTDGKNLMPPSMRTSASNANTVQRNNIKNTANSQAGKTGSITRSKSAADSEKVGGITRVRNNNGVGVVGGITKSSTPSAISGKIGGITRIKK